MTILERLAEIERLARELREELEAPLLPIKEEKSFDETWNLKK